MKPSTSLVLSSAAWMFLATPSMAEDGPAKVQLAVAPQAGQRFALQNDLSMTMNMMGMDIPTEVHQFLIVKAEEVAADGTVTLREKVARLWGKTSNPMMGDVEFDSDKPPEDGPPADQAAAMKQMMLKQLTALAGKEIVVRMGKDGQIKSVEASGVQGGDEMAKGLSAFGKLADKPLAVGESWDSETESQAMPGRTLKVKIKNTVKAVDAETVTISQTGTMEMGAAAADTGDPRAAMMAQMKLKSGTLKGTIKVLRKDGFVQSADLERSTEFEGEAGSMKMDMKVHTERKPAPAEDAKPLEKKPDDAKKPNEPSPAAPPKDK
jgi:uncharacterized protein DUF6263